jgi:hypothetical protein
VLAAFLLGTSGCYSFSTLGRARIVDQGHVELWAAPEALVVATPTGASIRPVGEVGVRYGLSNRVELDGRVTTLGGTVGPRIQLVRSPSKTHGIDVAIAPDVAFTDPDKVAFDAPILFGLNLPGEHQLVVAPRLVYQMRVSVPLVPLPVSFWYAGLSVGLALRVASRFQLMPEVALLTQLYAAPGFSSNVAGAVGLQGSIGVLFDP